MLKFKWRVYSDYQYEYDRSSTDANRWPLCFLPAEPGEESRESTPLEDKDEKGLSLYEALAETVTGDSICFKNNLMSFTKRWGMWEYDGYPWKERSADIRENHYEGYDEYEEYAANSFRVLKTEAILLNGLLNLWNQGRNKPDETFAYRFNTFTDYVGLPSSLAKCKHNEDESDPYAMLEALQRILALPKEPSENKTKTPYRGVNKIFLKLGNPYIYLGCEIDRKSITTYIDRDNTTFPIAGLRELFFPALEKREPSDTADDIKRIVSIIVCHFIQHRLYKYPMRLALGFESSDDSKLSFFFTPQNLLAAAWYQFAKYIFDCKPEWEPVCCAECGGTGIYNASDWVKSERRFYHHTNEGGRHCYKNYMARKKYREKQEKGLGKGTQKKAPS